MNIANAIAGKLPLFPTTPEEKVILLDIQVSLYAGEIFFICQDYFSCYAYSRYHPRLREKFSASCHPKYGLNKVIEDILGISVHIDSEPVIAKRTLARLQWIHELLNYKGE